MYFDIVVRGFGCVCTSIQLRLHIPIWYKFSYQKFILVIFICFSVRRASICEDGEKKYCCKRSIWYVGLSYPDRKVHGAYMGPTWSRQGPGEPQVGHIDLAISVYARFTLIHCHDILWLYWFGSIQWFFVCILLLDLFLWYLDNHEIAQEPVIPAEFLRRCVCLKPI